MDEQQAISMAVEAVKDLEGIRVDVSDIKHLLLDDAAEVALPDDSEAAQQDEVGAYGDAVAVEAVETVEDVQYKEHMQMHWATNALLVSVLCALLLSLGVQLWQCFSDKWRS